MADTQERDTLELMAEMLGEASRERLALIDRISALETAIKECVFRVEPTHPDLAEMLTRTLMEAEQAQPRWQDVEQALGEALGQVLDVGDVVCGYSPGWWAVQDEIRQSRIVDNALTNWRG